LALAETEPAARRLVNSGRLSVASCYDGSPLNGADGDFALDCAAVRPGSAARDAPLAGDAWLHDGIGDGFVGVWFCREPHLPAELAAAQSLLARRTIPVKTLLVSDPLACDRYGAERQGAYYLFRPDQHVVARWRGFDRAAVAAAVERASGRN